MASMKDVADTSPAEKPFSGPLQGKFVRLELLEEKHLDGLWASYEVDDSTWTWLPGGKPASKEAFDKDFMKVAAENIMFVVLGDPAHLNPVSSEKPDPEKYQPLAFVAYGGEYNLKSRTVETGMIAAPPLRRTYAATEVHYLMLRNVFSPAKGPAYRRVCWRTNVFNKASRSAAERMGYLHEGTFRNEMIDRGKSRDTAWYAIIEEDWPVMKEALERWLDLGNFREDGSQIKSLKDMKEEVK